MNGEPAVTPAGCVVNTSDAAEAGCTVNEAEVPVMEPCFAVSVVLCASYRVTEPLPTPLEKLTDDG